ncbi:sugar phosphate isomerase/epimerase [Virgibacillus pantothenticus]|uniref:sugar phosphate isomerase/epimerase family protein n=1 Tax=Virgibacillus pantothenticus TaxID=1473 RepID=UPI001C236193|nr:sugar phosphate isomerase/epimerase [Virgibacillus pantothenticus]MBU8568037.1 sugar phosphate isomerase/epimerase [Virgibacillus pantothenticus]MBU8601707.1 sugar phosphate isomerase/epimerase [Virgibacillus pantothenticus]MBU8636081.1 sugar phosphate isomerase/epimerase [Virgibacillus pantothenticus]MBU8643543.1 sugar phosphate isomerase/epimerase [Virgibacillus pantothenticus]MBU8647685.1 sugar phosphate isomerase/epimerase [Virgibacillus pantothenticus]
MKLGVFTVLLSDKSFEEMLRYVQKAGLKAVEIGTGGYPGNAHCDLDKLLESETKRKEYLEKVHEHGLTISAFSCHGNPLSPDKTFAQESHDTFVKTVKLASLMGVPVVNTFSGTPGDSDGAKYPNWPVTPWPNEYSDVLKWQWEEKLIPYWKAQGEFAKQHDVKIGLELHAGFLVHTPYTMLKLREATNDTIGANLDPSHLWWQGMDPVAAIKILGKANAIHHFHAKDTYIDQENVNMYGLTDMQPYSNVKTRAWTFRSVGYGHSVQEWSNIISALRTYDYDYVVSIEHEDPIMSMEEGLQKAIRNLNSVMIEEAPVDIWWI